MTADADLKLITEIHRELTIPADYAAKTKLPRFTEVPLTELVVAQLDSAGRPIVLTRAAADAWIRLNIAAIRDNIELQPFSSFRSYIYQKGLIAAQLKKGTSITEILKSLAAPGYSEHHTGEALDISTRDCPQANEIFKTTAAYQWLCANANKFGFYETYPVNNPYGIVFEPWHWRFNGKGK